MVAMVVAITEKVEQDQRLAEGFGRTAGLLLMPTEHDRTENRWRRGGGKQNCRQGLVASFAIPIKLPVFSEDHPALKRMPLLATAAS